MRSIGLFIADENGYYNRIELYQDEKISVTSSIQNVSDIAATTTDYSQSFSVPASKTNNRIFSHWYDNAVDLGFSHLSKKNAYIEIDTVPFRIGVLQLEGVDMESSQPVNYRLTFFGSLVSLKDLFNGLSLKDLTLDTSFDFACSGSVIKTKVTTAADDDVCFPLITSKRLWEYGGATPSNDISNVSGAITPDELFPAIKVRAVFDMIATQFGISFDGSIFNNYSFKNMFLWLKNSETFSYKQAPTIFAYDAYTVTDVDGGYTPPIYINLANKNFIMTKDNCSKDVYVKVNNFGTVGVPYNIYIYHDGVEFASASGVTVATATIQTYKLMNKSRASGVFDVRVVAAGNLTVKTEIQIDSFNYNAGGGIATLGDTYHVTTSVNQTATNPNIVFISRQFPDMKIEDFFTGILKMFNLTCYSTVNGVYTLEPLEVFYANGNIVNITKYVIDSSNKIDRIKSFKKVEFKYQQSQNLISANFLSTNGREFGDLTQDFNADGGDYSVKLPFEVLGYSRADNSDLFLGYCLKTDYTTYMPKPVLMYCVVPGSLYSGSTFYFNDGGGATSHNAYRPFCNETVVDVGPPDFGNIAFGNEDSLVPYSANSENGLYELFYQNYLENIFDIKTRNFKIKAVLPLSILTGLRLKDRIIIRDKRYIIQSFTTDLTTLEVDFDLITDDRIL